MADTFITAGDNIYITCNDDQTTNSGNIVRIRHLSTNVLLAEFNETGVFKITGRIERDGAHEMRNSAAGNGVIVQFVKDATNRLEIEFVSGTGVRITAPGAAGSLDAIIMRPRSDFIVHLDHAGGVTGTYNFIVRDQSGDDRVVFNMDNGDAVIFQINDAAGNWTHIVNTDTGAGDEAFMRIGGARAGTNSRRGKLFIHHDSKVDNERAGSLVLLNKNGGHRFLWVDANDKLRIHTADPGVNDTAGVVVGTQT